MVLKIAHIGDIHFSARTDRELGDGRIINTILQAIEEKNPDLVICTGDVFDRLEPVNSKPVADAMRFFSSIGRIVGRDKVMIVRGTPSHDPPGALSILRPYALTIDEGTVNLESNVARIRHLNIGNLLFPVGIYDFGGMYLLAIPAIGKTRLKIAGISSTDLISEAIGACPSDPIAIAAHVTVRNAVNEHGVPASMMDWEISTGDLVGFGQAVTMMGHIHKFQILSEAPLAYYAGSVGRYSVGEDRKKFIVFIDINDGGSASMEKIRLPASPSLVANVSRDNVDQCLEAVSKLIESDPRAQAKLKIQADVDAALVKSFIARFGKSVIIELAGEESTGGANDNSSTTAVASVAATQIIYDMALSPLVPQYGKELLEKILSIIVSSDGKDAAKIGSMICETIAQAKEALANAPNGN